MSETKEPELRIEDEQLYLVGYEFYKFYSVFKDILFENYIKAQEEEYVDKDFEFNRHYPVFCFSAFATSFLELQEKEGVVKDKKADELSWWRDYGYYVSKAHNTVDAEACGS